MFVQLSLYFSLYLFHLVPLTIFVFPSFFFFSTSASVHLIAVLAGSYHTYIILCVCACVWVIGGVTRAALSALSVWTTAMAPI